MSPVRDFREKTAAPARISAGETEQAVIATVLLHPERASEVTALFNEDEFHIDGYRTAFAAVAALEQRDERVDHLTILNETRRMPAAPGVESLDDLRAMVKGRKPLETDALRAAHATLRAYSQRRRLTRQLQEALTQAASPDNSADSIIDFLDTSFSRIRETGGYKAPVSFAQLEEQMRESYTDLHKGKSTAVATGFKALDEKLARGGLQRRQMIAVTAPTGSAKTALGMGICVNVAKRGGGALFFSLEMHAEDLFERVHSAESDVEGWKIRPGIYEREYGKLIDTLPEMSKMNIHIEWRDFTLAAITRTARNLVRKPGSNIDLIVVDYVQLMKLSEKSRSDQLYADMTEISKSLKRLAMQLNVPIIVISQMSREGAKSEKGKRSKFHMKETGQLENDSDVVIIIEMEPIKAGGETPALRPAEIRIDKQRRGPECTVNMIFDSMHVQFKDIRNGSVLAEKIVAERRSSEAGAKPVVKNTTPRPVEDLTPPAFDDDSIPF